MRSRRARTSAPSSPTTASSRREGDQVKIRCPFHDDAEPSCSVNLEQAGLPLLAPAAASGQRARVRAPDGEPRRRRSSRSARRRSCSPRSAASRSVAAGGSEGARKPKGGQGPEAEESPSTPREASPGAPGGAGKGLRRGAEAKPNKPLGFALKLDPDHPYLVERGISPELVERFGLGFCEKGIMAGRVCIPIHNADGQLVAYAGRWVGAARGPSRREGQVRAPEGLPEESRAVQPAPGRALPAPGRGRGLLRRDPAARRADPGRGAHGLARSRRASRRSCASTARTSVSSPSCSMATRRPGGGGEVAAELARHWWRASLPCRWGTARYGRARGARAAARAKPTKRRVINRLPVKLRHPADGRVFCYSLNMMYGW